ncbi:nitrate reductase [Pleomorphomonas oryzae]|uniref:nitrate reductase n=1 Tax=Pleomorphomonas oryzae TaxID=261934 RepID=UPI0004150920|nr:nitrate reductase [Pleomorphomonas oryzae]
MAQETRTTCPYCGVGCGVLVRVDDDGRTSVSGDPDHPANFGRLCSKGSALAETLGDDGRIHHPEIGGRQADWDEALDLVAGTFAQTIAEHGPEAVAFYLSGQLLTEDYYVANKLMKGFIGAANIDTNSRLCMASSVAGHRRAFGADTVPGNYEDIELADLVVIVGSNMAWCHPVLYQRLAAAKAARPEMAVVVIDPRRTATSDIADLHLSVRADGDVALFNGLLAHLHDNGWTDLAFVAEHTEGFEAALTEARRLGPTELAEITGLLPQEIAALYERFAGAEKVVTLFSQGVNQSSSGSDKVNAIINCHLLTGRIGRPGMGPLSLTGQPNAMGGREVGGLANMLAAHMNLDNAADRDRVGRFWAAPSLADRPGLKAVDLFEAVADGRVKALWIMATNPVVSMPDADRVRAAIAACPFVVVSDIQRDTDTARLAHVLLPSLGWSEKSGTVTNSERRISRQRAFRAGPGEARADWWQFAEVGRRMGFGDAFAYAGPHQVFAEHAGLSGFENGGARDFDISAHAGIDAASYERLKPFQWPQPADGPSPDGGSRFFADGRFYHPDGRARFVAAKGEAERRTNWGFPFVLNTGRIRDQWHTMTRTGKSPRLSAHLAEPFAEIHPADARACGIDDADLVEIESAEGGRVIVRALLTDRQARCNLFVPMHWTGETSALARVNALFPGRVDAVSGQPALKHTAVRLRRHDSAVHGFLVSSEKPEGVDTDYWALARTEHGWRLELAGSEPAEGWEDWLRRVAGLSSQTDTIGYYDRTGTRMAAFEGTRLVAALYVGEGPVAVSRPWAADQLGQSFADPHRRADVVAGRPGKGGSDKGAIVCACASVGINDIRAAIASGCQSVAAVGETTAAGTNCGSCRPEIRRILESMMMQAAE